MGSSIYYLYRLTCKLLIRPELAAEVQKISIRHAVPSQRFPKSSDTSLAEHAVNPALHKLILKGILHGRKVQGFKFQLSLDADHELLLTLLLPSLPNLHHLEMNFIPILTDWFARPMKRQGFPAKDQAPFQSLKTFSNPSSRHPQEGLSEKALAIFLGIPSLQSLRGVFLRQSAFYKYEGLLQDSVSNLVKVDLSGLRNIPAFLSDMLRACRSLKFLDLAWSDISLVHEAEDSQERIQALQYGIDLSDVPKEIDPLEAQKGVDALGEFLTALSSLAANLTALSLNYEELQIKSGPEYRVLLSFLRNSSIIKTMGLGMLFAFGLDHKILDLRHPQQEIPACIQAKRSTQLACGLEESLPSSIENLRLFRNAAHSIPLLLVGMEKVLAVAQDKFRSLKSVMVIDKENGKDWNDPVTEAFVRKMQVAAQKQGIELDIVRG